MPDSRPVARSVDELWLDCQQRLVAYIAHDLKGALNGVSVNVEVVRSRAGTPSADLARFANAAAEQAGIAIDMTVALLSIGRSIRPPAEVATIARQLTALIEDTLKSDGAGLELVVEGGIPGLTSAPPSVVRLILAEAMLIGVAATRKLAIRVRANADPTVDIVFEGAVGLPAEVAAAAAQNGIKAKTDGHGISIVFPAPTEPRTEDA